LTTAAAARMLPRGTMDGEVAMFRFVSTVAATLVLSITGIFTAPALATTTPTGHTWAVQAGSVPIFDANGPRGAGNRFYPASIAIHQGDSITVTPMGPHTFTYNRPRGPVFTVFAPSGGTTLADPAATLNSGFIGAGPGTFTVTFASTLPAGRYNFICALHLGMKETVDVMPAGAELPKTDADYAAIAQRQMTRDLATAERVNAAATEDREDEDGNPTVFVGAGTKRVTNLRFYPASITIRVGQTITFLKTKDPTEPHTVSFNIPPGLPMIAEFLPNGGSSFDGKGFVNSGFLSTEKQFEYFQLAGTGLPVALTKYSLTFTKAGDFKYVCAIHDGAGMFAEVHVR
jgi:plastocyanin